MKAIYITSGKTEAIHKAYDKNVRTKLTSHCGEIMLIREQAELAKLAAKLTNVEYIFSTWGMLTLSEAEIKQYFPALKALFYAAGSVQAFARPFQNCGVRVFSAWAANAVPVAEFTVAQIILACKGFFHSTRIYKSGDFHCARAFADEMTGNYAVRVGIIGAGAVGSLVAELLKTYEHEVCIFDPFITDDKIQQLGATQATLPDLFQKCPVISNHLADNKQTKKMLDYGLFSQMQKRAVFINTGRGGQIDDDGLIRALKEEPTRLALLDVSEPEPLPEGHPFFDMDNVILSPHIAGSMGNEIARMGLYMYEEFMAFSNNAPTRFEVTARMLDTMA